MGSEMCIRDRPHPPVDRARQDRTGQDRTGQDRTGNDKQEDGQASERSSERHDGDAFTYTNSSHPWILQEGAVDSKSRTRSPTFGFMRPSTRKTKQKTEKHTKTHSEKYSKYSFHQTSGLAPLPPTEELSPWVRADEASANGVGSPLYVRVGLDAPMSARANLNKTRKVDLF